MVLALEYSDNNNENKKKKNIETLMNSGSSLVRKLKVSWDIWMTMVTSTTSTCTSALPQKTQQAHSGILC